MLPKLGLVSYVKRTSVSFLNKAEELIKRLLLVA